MILSIDTTSHSRVIILLKKDNKVIAKKSFLAARQQAEKLIVNIDKLLVKNKIKLSQLTKIEVANQGDSFTALRIGVITANALSYALEIPVEAINEGGRKNLKFMKQNIVEPIYNHEPIIGKAKRNY